MASNGQPAALQVTNLTVTFPSEDGGLQAVQDLTFAVRAEEFVCILGPSGSGKSTRCACFQGCLRLPAARYISLETANRASATFFSRQI